MKKLQGQSKVINNFFNVKKYNDDYYKVVYFKYPIDNFQDEGKERKRDVNEIKLKESISRSRSTIFEYSMCNEFEYFVTLTINKDKHNRYDLKSYYKSFSKFLNNYNYRYSVKVQYLLIPEKHRDGAWHLHGLIKGIPLQHLKKNEHGYLDWSHYRDKFGYISLDPIRSIEKVSCYITKYINKDLENSIKELGAHLYYVSKGLKKAEEIKRGTLLAGSIPYYDYENDYVKIKWLDNDSIASFINSIT